MSSVSALLLVLTLPVLAPAQTQTISQGPPGVTVVSFEWRPLHKDERRSDYGLQKSGDYAQSDPLHPARQPGPPTTPARDPNRLEMPSGSVRPTDRVFYGYESSLHLKNDSAKTITAVEWEHVFYADAGRRTELKRFKVRKKAEVAPGEQKILASAVRSERYRQLPPQTRQGVSIKRVEYSDGSVWRRP